MDRIYLKQHIPVISRVIFSLPIFFMILLLSNFYTFYLFLLLIFLLVFGFNYEYIIVRNGSSLLVVKIFNKTILSIKKSFITPDYISLMYQSFYESSHFSWYPNVFPDTKFKLYTIKFFKGNNRETVFKTDNKEEAIQKANMLSKLLNVRINNTLKP